MPCMLCAPEDRLQRRLGCRLRQPQHVEQQHAAAAAEIAAVCSCGTTAAVCACRSSAAHAWRQPQRKLNKGGVRGAATLCLLCHRLLRRPLGIDCTAYCRIQQLAARAGIYRFATEQRQKAPADIGGRGGGGGGSNRQLKRRTWQPRAPLLPPPIALERPLEVSTSYQTCADLPLPRCQPKDSLKMQAITRRTHLRTMPNPAFMHMVWAQQRRVGAASPADSWLSTRLHQAAWRIRWLRVQQTQGCTHSSQSTSCTGTQHPSAAPRRRCTAHSISMAASAHDYTSGTAGFQSHVLACKYTCRQQ